MKRGERHDAHGNKKERVQDKRFKQWDSRTDACERFDVVDSGESIGIS